MEPEVAGFSAGDTWLDALGVHGIPEPVGVIAAIAEQPLRVGHIIEQRCRADVVDDLTGGHEQGQRAPVRVAAGSRRFRYRADRNGELHRHRDPRAGRLWNTPEFAFLGHKLWDQDRLYENFIVAEPTAFRMADRGGAWAFLHAALAWKTASANSDRLYSRAEVIDFVKRDFEWFSDNHKTSNPGFDNPPANVLTNGEVDERKLFYAGASRFGIMGTVSEDFGQADFSIGYWLVALGIGEKFGFNAAIRSASAKAGSVIDFLIARHRQRVVGRINNAPRANVGSPDPYAMVIWRRADILSAGGNVAALPQNFAAVVTQNGNSSSWDSYTYQGTTYEKDGQGMDQLIAGPSILKNQLGQTGSDLDTAHTTATGWRDAKKAQEAARGVEAGSGWFRYLNAVHNPALG